jgi:hypothetical protein
MSTVLHRTTKEFLGSVHTPDYPTGTWIVNPDLSSVSGVPIKYWKITGDAVSEMNQTEKDAVDATLANQVIGDKNFKVEEFTGSKKVKETWYSTDNEDGTYSDCVEETTYTHQGNLLISETLQPKWPDGSNRGSAETWNYYRTDGSTIKKKQGI